MPFSSHNARKARKNAGADIAHPALALYRFNENTSCRLINQLFNRFKGQIGAMHKTLRHRAEAVEIGGIASRRQSGQVRP